MMAEAVGTLQAQAQKEKAFFAHLFNADGTVTRINGIPKGGLEQRGLRIIRRLRDGDITSFYLAEER